MNPIPKYKTIRIKNFKSLKEVELKLSKFNVVIGSNATGKTNLLEGIHLANQAVYPISYPPTTFQRWWGYKNAVYMMKEELPISFFIEAELAKYNINYEFILTGSGGLQRFIQERLEIKNVLKIERKGNYVSLEYDEEFTKDPYVAEALNKLRNTPQHLQQQIPETYSILNPQAVNLVDLGIIQLSWYLQDIYTSSYKQISVVSPIINTETGAQPLMQLILSTLLRPWIYLNVVPYFASQPVPLPSYPLLDIYGGNLPRILFSLYQHEGKFPETVQRIIEKIFPEISLQFEFLPDGRITIKAKEQSLEFLSPNLSAGLFKILTISTALSLKTSMLLIDELENSLHLKSIEVLIDEFRNSDTTVIVTTHSPAVIDLCKPEEIIIAEKKGFETILKREPNPEELKKKLIESGVSLSEYYFYG